MQFTPLTSAHTDYLSDESALVGTARAIALPTGTDALVEAVQEAAALGAPLTIQGGKTGLMGGGVPQNSCLISTGKLNRILGLRQTQGDFYLRVACGCTLQGVSDYLRRPTVLDGFDPTSAQAVARLLEGPSYRFAPDPTEQTATLGGAFATGAMGPSHLSTGAFARHVQSLLWITPTGEQWNICRGDYRFNASGCPLPNGQFLKLPTQDSAVTTAQACHPGLDLIDFLSGSEGRLGVAAELKLRLSPVPPVEFGVVCFFQEETAAACFLSALDGWHKAQPDTCPLSGCFYFGEALLTLMTASRQENSTLSTLAPFPAQARYAVYLALSGSDGDLVEQGLETLLALISTSGGSEDDTWAGQSPQELAQFKALCHLATELVNAQVSRTTAPLDHPVRMGLDVLLDLSNLQRISRQAREDCARLGLPCYLYGPVLDGRLQLVPVPSNPRQQQAARALVARA